MDSFNITAEFFVRNYSLLLAGEVNTVLTTLIALYMVFLFVGLTAEIFSQAFIGWRAVTTAPIFIAAYIGYLAYQQSPFKEVLEQASLTILIYLSVLACTYPFLHVIRNLNTLKWVMIKNSQGSKSDFFAQGMASNKAWLIFPFTFAIIVFMSLKFTLYKPATKSVATTNEGAKSTNTDSNVDNDWLMEAALYNPTSYVLTNQTYWALQDRDEDTL